MDVVSGALGLLPSKLLELLKDEYKLQNGVKKQVESLYGKLETMHAALRKVAAVPWDQLDEQVKVWARKVREASYDMEDIVDTLIVRVEGQDQADPSRLKRAMKKMGDLFTTSIGPRLSALYTKVSQLVGTEEPKDKVIKMLTDGEDMETKIVSIVGFGGLGKTTLARAVYENLSRDICFKAIISVGQNPNLKKVLKDIVIGLDMQHYTSKDFDLNTFDEKQLIDKVREFLKDKS